MGQQSVLDIAKALWQLPVPVKGPLPGAHPGAVRAPDPWEAALLSAPGHGGWFGKGRPKLERPTFKG